MSLADLRNTHLMPDVRSRGRADRYGRPMVDRADGDNRAVPKIEPQPDEATKSVFDRVRSDIWRLIVATVASCMRYRVTGLAAEAAFFAILSIPPLIFALAGAIGFVTDRFSAAQVEDVRSAVIDLSGRALTDTAVD